MRINYNLTLKLGDFSSENERKKRRIYTLQVTLRIAGPLQHISG
jgi:hypothetical protein